MAKQKQKGQAMLITVLSIGGAILGVTTIAGLLMLYQIRATTDIESSAKAIFAADAGVEWAQFDFYCGATSTLNPQARCINSAPGTEQPASAFANCETGCPTAPVVCSYIDGTGNPATVPCSNASATSAVARGISLGTERAFLLTLTGATATVP